MTRGGSPWTWRAPGQEGDGSQLLYEPGNWGDVLKGSWVLLALGSLLREGDAPPVRYLDPCAGRPEYPLTQASARRLERLPPGVFREAQEPFREAGSLASTGALVRAACASCGRPCEATVFDLDETRLREWQELENVTTLSVASGEDALAGRGAFDLILVDPYDFFDHWGRWTPPAAEAARGALVLIYLYNKSPRGPGYLDQYRRLRAQLRSAVNDDVDAVLGRIGSDAVLPRAYHEVVLLGPPARVAPVKPLLQTEARALARVASEDGAFEEIGGD